MITDAVNRVDNGVIWVADARPSSELLLFALGPRESDAMPVHPVEVLMALAGTSVIPDPPSRVASPMTGRPASRGGSGRDG